MAQYAITMTNLDCQDLSLREDTQYLSPQLHCHTSHVSFAYKLHVLKTHSTKV